MGIIQDQLKEIINVLERDVTNLESLKTKASENETHYSEGYRDGISVGVRFIKSSINIIKTIIKVL